MDDDFIEAINATADTSFDARIATRPSGVATAGFYRYGNRSGERSGNGAPFKITNEPLPKYFRMHCTPNDEDKRGAWQLQEEYLAGRLGKNVEENIRNWNTVKWIDKHYRVTRTLAEALPPLNIYVGDKKSQSAEGTGSPTGPDDEAPDEAGNEGVEFESINVGLANSESDQEARWWKRLPDGSIKVMDEDGTTRRLDIKADGYALLRLMDALEEIDKSAKIDVNDLTREAPPMPEQVDFPSSDQRAESGKIIRILMMGMRTLWHPVIRAIAHATMTSLGKTQGVGDKVAAAVGRQRVIEGLRLAESIRKGLGRQEFVVRRTLEPSYTVATCLDEIIRGVLARLGGQTLDDRRATWPPYRDWQGSCCYIDGMRFVPSRPLPANDNHRFDAVALKAA